MVLEWNEMRVLEILLCKQHLAVNASLIRTLLHTNTLKPFQRGVSCRKMQTGEGRV